MTPDCPIALINWPDLTLILKGRNVLAFLVIMTRFSFTLFRVTHCIRSKTKPDLSKKLHTIEGTYTIHVFVVAKF